MGNRRQALELTLGGVSPLHRNETLIALLYLENYFQDHVGNIIKDS